MTQYQNFSTAYEEGKSAKGALYSDWQIDTSAVNGNQVVLTAVLDTGDIELRDANGDLLEVYPGEAGITTVWTLRAQGDSWLVIDARDLA